jgi:hypothetical protein
VGAQQLQTNVAIANGAQLSDAVDLLGFTLCAVETPAAFTGTAITFEVSNDNSTFVPVHKEDGNAYSITVAASRATIVDIQKFRGFRYLKIKSGSAEAAARTVVLHYASLG